MVDEATEHMGETKPMANHDHDMVHEVSKRLDAVWRYDQYIANAEGQDRLRQYWMDVKNQDLKNIETLKELIKAHANKGCF
ncbi:MULTISPECIES: hypothetical protein [unclassified Roseitalea]|uniref:hypothetical protein n=1 Tax=unclassified Roseitalea TaxID=2639107 RepID=UPI00273DD6B3|nr:MULTISPECIES: hypothetical protein [unclassified Roseitalea]